MSTAVAKAKPADKIATVRSLLNSDAVKIQIRNALPKHLTPERMIRVIMTGIQKTPKLADCSQYSLVGAIVQAAELGLEPNTPLGLAYIIPYGTDATFQIGYRGFLALARRSGEISFAVSEIVHKNDRFELYMGTDRRIVHVPLLTGDRGEKIGVYSLVQYKDGTTDFEYMTADQVLAVKKRSKAASSGPWVTDTDEMWRKTPMRRHAKRWPMTVEDAEKVVRAAVADEYADFGVTNNGDMTPEPEKPAVITENQRTAIVEAAKKNGVSEQLTTIVSDAGFEMLAHITVDKFSDVMVAIAKAGKTIDAVPEQSESFVAPGIHDRPADAGPEPDEPTEEAKAESTLEDLIAHAKDRIREITGGKARETAEILNGRKIDSMDLKVIKGFHAELDKLETA